MAQVHLLRSIPRQRRRLDAPRGLAEENRRIALEFGREYFDGTRYTGYGGYHYDGRWVSVAADAIQHFDLRSGESVLDVGCAKGFLVKDLADQEPGLTVVGLDVSAYALEHAPADVERLVGGNALALPFAGGSFDVALAINVVHNLDRDGVVVALRELMRVSRRGAFVQVDAYRTEAEREVFIGWCLTARTFLTPDGWLALFADAGYEGDYDWTILDADPAWTDLVLDADRDLEGG